MKPGKYVAIVKNDNDLIEALNQLRNRASDPFVKELTQAVLRAVADHDNLQPMEV